MTGKQDPAARRWVDEAEEALYRTGDAPRAAWADTHVIEDQQMKPVRSVVIGLVGDW